MRKGYRELALGAVQAAQSDVRRTDLEITDSGFQPDYFRGRRDGTRTVRPAGQAK
jgi:hypothetical protein